jgi:N utilization substance protein B
MTRREEREIVFQLLFETEFHADTSSSEVYMNSLAAENAVESPYIRDTYFGTVENRAETDKLIAESAHKWKISRMAVVTRTILRLAVYEMMWGGIPPKAAINEAVEIAKIYDDDAAPAFINGILNQIARKNSLIRDCAEADAGDAQ